MNTTDLELDARGLNCPLPILRTRKKITGMTNGQTLRVIATDPGSVKDMEAFCRQTGTALLATEESGGDFLFMLQKG